MTDFRATWHEAHREAAALARSTGCDAYVRKITDREVLRVWGAPQGATVGFTFGLASRNGDEYATCEIVRPGDPPASSRNPDKG